MKKIIFITLLYFIVTNTFSQIIKPIVNEKTKLYDYINTANNNKINKYSYDQASTFSDGMAKVNRNGLWGFINQNGDEIIPCRYLSALDFKEGLAAVSIGDLIITENFSFPNNEKYGVINKEGKVVIPFEFKEIGLYIKGLARASKLENKELWGWIDNKGNWTITPKFSDADDFNENGMAKVRIVKKNLKDQNETAYGYVDYKGNYIIQPNYSYLGDINEGLILVGKNEKEKDSYYDRKYGFIDLNENIVIPLIYENANKFSEGLALVAKEGKYGFIDKRGIEKIPLVFDIAYEFNNNKSLVRSNLKYNWINKEGVIINKKSYDVVLRENLLNENSENRRYSIVSNNGFWGILDDNLEVIIPISYDSIGCRNDTIIALKDDTVLYFNNTGKNLNTKKYNYVKNNEQNYNLNLASELYRNIDTYETNLNEGYIQDSSILITKKESKYGILNYSKLIICNNIYDSIKFISEVREIKDWNNGKNKKFLLTGYRNNKLDMILVEYSKLNSRKINIIETNFSNIYNYGSVFEKIEDYCFRYSKNGKWGIIKIDFSGNLQKICSNIYDNIGFIKGSKYLIPVQKNKKWGLFNKTNNTMGITFLYDKIGPIYYGKNYSLIPVMKNNKWAVINQNNKLIIPYLYDEMLYFTPNGICGVKYKGKWGYINKTGDVVCPIIFDKVDPLSHSNVNGLINKMFLSIEYYGYPYEPITFN